MLNPTPMQKVRIIMLKSHVEDLIRVLHEAGLMEIKKTKINNLERGRPLSFFDEVSTQLVRLRAIKSVLDEYKSAKVSEKNYENLDGRVALEEAKALKLDERVKELTDEVRKLSDEISVYQGHLSIAEKIKVFKNIDFSKLKSRTLSYELGEISAVKIDGLNNKLRTLLDNYTILSPPNPTDTVPILILYKKKDDVELSHMLTDTGFVSLLVPPGLSRPAVTISEYHNEIRAREVRIKEANDEMRGLANSSYEKVLTILNSLNVAAERSEITSKFSFSSRACVLEGWVKTEDYSKLEKVIDGLGDQAQIEALEAGHDDMPPTVLQNPKEAGPFEFITKSYSFPNYNEMDPSLIYMLFVPLLYGMIVGDVVYGLISIAISQYLMKAFKNSYVMSNVARLWFISAFPTIFFGLVFDEWMGTSLFGLIEVLHQWGFPLLISGNLYEGFHRVHRLTELIGYTALVGLLQLGLGFILGAINHWKHHRKHAYAKIAWLGVEIGGTLAVCAMILGILPAAIGPYSLVLLVISIIGLFLTEGVAGILEVPGLMGNVLSYARIAAIGIVGVILAEIINDFLMPSPSQGIFALLFFPLFIVLHSVNAFIAMFEALIQGGRLNLLEFRSKFVEGGGIPFRPFSLRSKN